MVLVSFVQFIDIINYVLFIYIVVIIFLAKCWNTWLQIYNNMATRNVSRHDIFGNAKELCNNMLPTNLQVSKYFLQIKTRKNESNKDNYKAVSDAVISLWSKASIPTIQSQSVIKRVESLICTGSELCRSKSSSKRRATFMNSLNSLFDIAACKCEISYNESTKQVSLPCNCPRDFKVPKEEILFLYDQRNSRQMFIGGVDITATNRLQKRMKRKHIEKEETTGKRLRQTCGNNSNVECHSLDDVEGDETDQVSDCKASHDSDDEFHVNDTEETRQVRVPLPNLAKEADRYGVSDRAAASLATAVLIDLGIVSKEDQSFVIDKNKVHRERVKLRKFLQTNVQKSCESITGIYFDGKRDNTLIKVSKNDKWYGDTTVEDHYVLVAEPGGHYLTHVTTTSGRSTDIATSILTALRELGATDTITAIGCDSTNTNTGCKAGVIRQLEIAFGHPVNWFICMLHVNELPLRHLFLHLDGRTSGASSFTGPIGTDLQHCEQKAIVKFKEIECGNNMPVLDARVLDDLSCDQKYLYAITAAVRSGVVSDDLKVRKCGALNHS